MGSSNAAAARTGGLLTTRVGSGFVARASTRMNVSGNLALSRAGNAASKFPVRSVQTPYGVAIQGQSAAALAARNQVNSGAKLYRTGTMGRSEAGEAQFWALENPNTLGFASRYGIPAKNVAGADMLEVGLLKPKFPFVTRSAPGVGENVGGGIEVVVPRDGVKLNWFSGGE